MGSLLRTSNLLSRGTPGVGPLRRGLVVLELVFVVTAVACSSGSPSKSASATGATVRPVANGGSAPATPASAPSPAAGTPDEAFCSLRNVANLTVDYDNPDLTAAVVSLQKAVVLAPAEIKPDVQTIADVEIPIFQGRVPADQIDQRIGDPKVLKATRDIATWSATHCR